MLTASASGLTASLLVAGLLLGGCRSDGSSSARRTRDAKPAEPAPVAEKPAAKPVAAAAAKPDAPIDASAPLNTPVEPEAAAKLGYAIRWFSIGPQLEKGSIASVSGDLLLFMEPVRGMVHVHEAATGKRVWSRQITLQTDLLLGVTTVGDILYANSSTFLYRVNLSDGTVHPPIPLGSPVAGGPAKAGGYLVFGGMNGRAAAFDTRTGYVTWEYRMQGSVKVPPVANERQLLVVDSTGKYTMLNHDGRLSWTSHTWGPVSATPVLTNEVLLIASEDRTLYAVRASNGQDMWKFADPEVPFKSAPFLAGRFVIQEAPGTGLRVLNLTNGREVLRLDAKVQPLANLSGGTLLVREGNELRSMELPSGKTKISVPCRPLSFVLPQADGSLLVVGDDRQMLRLDPVSK